MEEEIYEFVFDENQMAGVYGVSLVKNPAIDVDFISFSNEEKQEWKLTNEEKKILTSAVLIPNQKIYRKDIQGKPGYVYANEITIERLQQNFAKNHYNKNSSLEHSEPIEGVYFFESWVVEDPLNDKANALGFKDIVKGTWFMSMKVDNDEIWNDYVKTGEIKGFSIDGQLAVKSTGIKLSNNNNNNKEIKLKKMDKNTIEQIVLSAIKSVALASDLMEYKDGEKSYFASSLEMGSIVTDAAGSVMANAEFVIDEKMYKTDEMGAIVSIEDVMKEEESAPEVEIEVEQVDEIVDAPVDEAPAVDEMQVMKDKIAEQEAMIAELEAKLIEAEAKLVESESEKVEMSKEIPASSGIKDVPTPIVSNKNESLVDMIKRLRQ